MNENQDSGAVTSAAPIASDVVESAPANTSSVTIEPPVSIPTDPEAVTTGQDEVNPQGGEEVTPTANPEGGEGGGEATPPESPVVGLTPEKLEELSRAQHYQPQAQDVDILDEFGNLDPAKFQSFMRDNNASVFEQAVNAVSARGEAEKIESATWDNLRGEYSNELNDNPGLEKVLRGARIQDIIAGGDGDLNRLAKEVIGPMRKSAIQAVEDVNRQVSEAEELSTYKPQNSAPQKQAAPLMTQLREALQAGDHGKAQQIRHAIRKERISGNNS